MCQHVLRQSVRRISRPIFFWHFCKGLGLNFRRRVVAGFWILSDSHSCKCFSGRNWPAMKMYYFLSTRSILWHFKCVKFIFCRALPRTHRGSSRRGLAMRNWEYHQSPRHSTPASSSSDWDWVHKIITSVPDIIISGQKIIILCTALVLRGPAAAY